MTIFRPGTCCLIHSRSKSGGIVRYTPGYNGSAAAQELVALGVRFDTDTEYTPPRYQAALK